YGDLFFIGGTLCVLGALWRAVLALMRRPDPVTAYEQTYATVGAHVAEFFFWVVWGLVHALTRHERRGDHARRAALSLVLLLVMLLVPLAALAAAGTSTLSSHGWALGIGALTWSYVLEFASVPERASRLADVKLLKARLWIWSVLLALS